MQDFSRFDLMALLKEEFRLNEVNSKLNHYNDENYDKFVKLKSKCIYHVNLGNCCSKAELFALIVYLDDLNLQKKFRNIELGID